MIFYFIMPLRKIQFIPNGYYHVYNRGSEKRIIFSCHRDYSKFLQKVEENAKKFGINILCYCLMLNHFHFILQQAGEKSITLFMNAIQLGYAKYFNVKYERVGPLFQGRFKAKSIESDEYLLHLSAYIHKNSIADLVDSGNPLDSRNLSKQLREFPYSSYREYIGLEPPHISKRDIILSYFSKSLPQLSYEKFVENFLPDYEALASLLYEDF